MRLFKRLPILLLTFALGSAQAQESAEPRDLGPVLKEVLSGFEVPGVGAAIVTSAGLVAQGVAGVRERGTETLVQAGDRFHIGSCTKAMTATLVAHYVEAGRLGWETTLQEALPELAKGMHATWHSVRVSQLLSHTAGVPTSLAKFKHLWPVYSSKDEPMLVVRPKFIAGLMTKAPHVTPGTGFAYSNYGYVTLGTILQGLVGKPWEQLMREQLFEPLGMQASGFGGPDAPYFAEPVPLEDADGEALQPRGHFEDGRVTKGFDNVRALGPAGTVHCTLADWGKFARLHLRGARGEQGLLLKPSSFTALHAPGPGSKHLLNWRFVSYGGGWNITTRQDTEGSVLMHDGSNTAWFAFLWIVPEEDFAVLVSCNQGGRQGRLATEAVVDRLIADLKAR
ncbi:MAG: CubicO group peptidase (beta-lactamase class C family) [Planctomycetota bacterium]|jgi:CubicO group peptidase (beta-lactamase class C family)